MSMTRLSEQTGYLGRLFRKPNLIFSLNFDYDSECAIRTSIYLPEGEIETSRTEKSIEIEIKKKENAKVLESRKK